MKKVIIKLGDFIKENPNKVENITTPERLKNFNDFVKSLKSEYSKKSTESQISASELYLNS